MIVPLVDESEWDEILCSLPVWFAPSRRTVLIAPHPDDETLAMGGFLASQLAAGVDITVVAVTDGELAYGPRPGLAAIRRIEQEKAMARLGLPAEKIIRLQLPDSDVACHEGDLVTQLLHLVSEETHLVAPWRGDYHPDHEACGRAAEAVASLTGAALTSYFFWTWHRGTPADLAPLTLRRIPLSSEHLIAKKEALSEHRSQLQDESGSPILPANLLAPAYRPYEVVALS